MAAMDRSQGALLSDYADGPARLKAALTVLSWIFRPYGWPMECDG